MCVFGSFWNEGGRKCELFTDKAGWTTLVDMHQNRSMFTPVVWKGKIYLCGGKENVTIETFDGTHMSIMALTLPKAGDTMGVVRGDCLLLWTYDTVSVLSLPHEAAEPVMVAKPRPGLSVDTTTSPVLYNGLLFTINSGHVCKYSPKDCRRAK